MCRMIAHINGNKMKQSELFEAETHWFHVFKSMIDSGDVAKIGPHAVTVYLVIKSYTNYSTGRAFPSIETIVEKSGISDSQVKRELITLEKFGYITKKRIGRRNEYTLREKISIKDGSGRPSAIATWDYLPAEVQRAVADLKNAIAAGIFTEARIVHIDRLQVEVNITEVKEGGINFNIQSLGDIDKLPEIMKEKLLDAYVNAYAKHPDKSKK